MGEDSVKSPAGCSGSRLEVQVQTVSLLTVRFSGGSAGTSAMIVVTSVRLSRWQLSSM